MHKCTKFSICLGLTMFTIGIICMSIVVTVYKDRQNKVVALFGIGLGLIVMSVLIVPLVWLLWFICGVVRGSISYTARLPSRSAYNDSNNAETEQVHQEMSISHWLLESIPGLYRQSNHEPDYVICEKIMRKWHLPLSEYTYNINDAAFLLHCICKPVQWRSVREAAANLLELAGQVDSLISRTFENNLVQIKRHSQPFDYSAEANIYALLKQKSLDAEGLDYSPKTSIHPEDMMPYSAQSPTAPIVDPNSPSANQPTVDDDGLPTYDEAIKMESV